jgi:hypothetical protein
VTHCRQVMLEELQRRNFAPTTISTSPCGRAVRSTLQVSARPTESDALPFLPSVSAPRAEDAAADPCGCTWRRCVSSS